ncbi:halocyanin domain-containing protein [Natrononativus amylolyticus]|uniref:halocyanin domain-containing protein n=1 Tax=Natrononativus amylolyticus TaxID=2963434 RepID=UPI0020CDDACB|nr:halocyanin domain-containing protein [Natrononativus amylolyticus]
MRRRTFLGVAGGAALAAVATAPAASAAESDAFDDWMADVPNYDGDVADETGADEVRIAVGADDGFVYDPPAVRIDPGTTVVWEWTGEGGMHDVAAEDDSFQSEYYTDAGETFEHTFDEEATHLYGCTPHIPMGMKAAVVVGGTGDEASEDEPATPATEGTVAVDGPSTTAVGTALAFLLVLLSPFGLWLRESIRER